jgi:hypothetical protein
MKISMPKFHTTKRVVIFSPGGQMGIVINQKGYRIEKMCCYS